MADSEADFRKLVVHLLNQIDDKVEKNNALIRSLAHATGTTDAELRKAASELGIPARVTDPGHNEVDPE